MRHAFANVEFDEMSATLRIDGRDVDIEPRPLAVLAELLRRPNEVVTKEEMLDAVWAGKPTVEHVLANAVSKLRTVLGPAGAARIVTVHRLGYRFVGPVHHIETAGTPLTAEPGMVVPGREGFVLERRLSGGGQSEVWLATHAKLDQKRVFKFASDALQLSALKREYTLYRVLSKTLGPRDDIAVVVDANFARPPFFIECLYAGPNLVEWGVRDGHLKRMTFQERLALFLQIAQAVSTAHSVGVLHKDLKPTNVLIDGAPGRWQIRLTDFGSGRMLDWSQLDALQVTAHGLTLKTAAGSVGQLSGTPLYVAPELLAGHAPTVQSDLYALGVLLFQILSVELRQPLTTGWQRRIDDPLLQQDIAEATESMPEDRIGSVPELILRLQRLDIRRVEQARRTEQDAAAAQAVAKAQRARLRRPWIAAAMAALTVVLSLSLWSQGRTKDALRSAELAGVQMRAVNDFLTKDVLASIDLAMAGGRRTLTMLDVMRRAASHVGERFAGQPRTEAAVRTHLARMFQRMVSTTDADVQYVAALSALQPVTASDDVQALAIRFERVRLLYEMSQREAADAELAAATALAGQHALDAPTELGFFAARARFYFEQTAERLDEAEVTARRLLVLADTVPSLDESLRMEARLAQADVQLLRNDVAGARATLHAIASSRVAGDAIDVVTIARYNIRVAAIQRDAGRMADSETLLAATRKELAKADVPSEYHIAYVDSELGHVFKSSGRLGDAAATYRRAHQGFLAVLGDDHQFTRITEKNVADVELDLGHTKVAYDLLLKLRPWFNAHATGGRWVPLETSLAGALLDLGRSAEALTILEPLPGAAGDNAPGSSGEVEAFVRAYKGLALRHQGRDVEARAFLQRARDELRQRREDSGDGKKALVARIEKELARLGSGQRR